MLKQKNALRDMKNALKAYHEEWQIDLAPWIEHIREFYRASAAYFRNGGEKTDEVKRLMLEAARLAEIIAK